MVEYWHWHTLHYGTETYWGGVLPHSGVPGRAYRELSALGAELRSAGPELAGTSPDADVAILWDSESRWALAFQPSLQRPDGSGDPESYLRIVNAFYRGAFDAGLQVEVVRAAHLFGRTPEDVVADRPVLVVPAFYVASDEQLRWLDRYAAAGGHLVLGPRTAYADPEARARAEAQPARLTEAAGAWYGEFTNVDEPVPVSAAQDSAADGGLQLPADAAATGWVDALQVGDPLAGEGAAAAQVLARYEHPFLGGWAAVTSRAHGAGRVTVVGTVPGRSFAKGLSAWLVPTPVSGWSGLPGSVTVHTSSAVDGRRVHVVHNWSWDEVRVGVPVDAELRAGRPDGAAPRLTAGDQLRLGAWDVLVLVSPAS